MSSTPLDHDLHLHFPRLREFDSTKLLERSDLYRELKPKVLQVLNGYETADFAPANLPPKPFYHAVAWNIERGIHLDGIIQILKNHPALSNADLYLITETDLGMARSGNRNIARELAQALQLNYLFAPSYLNLSKGAGEESEVSGDNSLGIHGNAILSRYPIHRPRLVSLPNAYDKMKGREKRLGNQRAVVGTIEFPGAPLRTACVHLDVRSTQERRKRQLEAVIDAIREEGNSPALVGGDWNTSTYDSHRAASAIIGFWIRVFMGVDNMIRNHYPHPDRLFEKKLFQMLEQKGFDYKGCNERGAGTTHYSVEDIKQYKNLREWIPQWCFRFVEWSLKNHDGRCSFKLDWFTQRGLKVSNAKVIGDLRHNGHAVSDHDAIVVDFIPQQKVH